MNSNIVAIHYPLYACTRCNGRGYLLTPVSREDYPCSHITYKRVLVAPEIVERERLAAEQEERGFEARLSKLVDTL